MGPIQNSELQGKEKIEKVNSAKKTSYARAGVAQWIEWQPVNQRVTGSIPSLGHMHGFWTRSPVGGV